MGYPHRVGVSLSVLVNVILGGQANQPVSARQHERKRAGKFNLTWLIDRLTSEGHCRMSWVYWITLKKR